MLLFLLCFYEHYDLLNCEGIVVSAKFNESLLVDHHRQNLQQANAVLKDLERRSRNFSSLVADHYRNDTRREGYIFENFLKNRNDEYLEHPTRSPIVAFQHSKSHHYDPHLGPPPPFFSGSYVTPAVVPPGSIDVIKDLTPGPQFPEQLETPTHPMYPGQMMHPSIFSGKTPGHYMASYSYSPYAFKPGTPGFYKEPPFMDRFLHVIPHGFQNPFHPIFAPSPSSSTSSYPKYIISKYTSIRDSTLTTTGKTIDIGHHAKIWFEEIAPYTRTKKPKTKKASKHQTHPYPKSTTVPARPGVTEPKPGWSIVETPNLVQLFEHGYLQMALHKINKNPGVMQDGTHNWMTTTKDVWRLLHGVSTLPDDSFEEITVEKLSTTQSPQQRYHDLMNKLDEGYLMVFGIEVFRLIAVKNKREVQEILGPMEKIFQTMSEKGDLAGLGDPLLIVIEKLAAVASIGENIEIVQTYASMMFHALLQRRQVLSPEVNTIIDQAEEFYSDSEGVSLLRSLRQFEEYPYTSKGSVWICESLIQSFLQPYQRQSALRSHIQLLDSINAFLRQRFPLLIRKRGERARGATLKLGVNPRRTTHQLRMKRTRKRRVHPPYTLYR